MRTAKMTRIAARIRRKPVAEPFTQSIFSAVKLFQKSIPSAVEETASMNVIGTAVIHAGRLVLTNHSVAASSVSAASSWFADANIVQSCFDVLLAPRRSPAARRTTTSVPKYMLRTPFFSAPSPGRESESSCQLNRARRVPASTVVIRNAETESSMNDSAIRFPVSAVRPMDVKNLTQNPAMVDANICTGSMP